MAYHEVTFEVEPEACKCQSSKFGKTNDKTIARYEICRILRGMLDHILSLDESLSYPLISKLQKIMTNLEDKDLLKRNDSNEVKNLVVEHSIIGFSEIIIKKRLLEIAENNNDGSSSAKWYLSLDPQIKFIF